MIRVVTFEEPGEFGFIRRAVLAACLDALNPTGLSMLREDTASGLAGEVRFSLPVGALNLVGPGEAVAHEVLNFEFGAGEVRDALAILPETRFDSEWTTGSNVVVLSDARPKP